MKTFYIHGLDSFPVPEKIKIMEEVGLSVISMHLDYRRQPDAYEILKIEAMEKNAAVLIGSSLGGSLAYWLAEDLGLPCLLFNPAMDIDKDVGLKIPKITKRECPMRFVVLGESDDSVDPLKNLSYFRERERDGLDQKVLTCHWLGHQIDFDTFGGMVSWFVHGLKRKEQE
ncbi:MAG: hypothetical protein K9G67_04995 [Bacteroidales bacterium]|nr:hypothetical protein [Bacteroidales bacterium]MCF8344761.1 hypothetical protein [Bacteroidales bacterium]MCF8352216.1 hypothetical protein [Bacteroidales bacterium]MCF8375689.1 hypothetical protein [Bacteroidales bacterium]MCF8400289.1 hypothetical protein [Bacteroidales bacterium]